MNLWRIDVDAATGQATGVPEAVTIGVQASAGLPSFSKDGTRLAFRSRVGSVNPVEIPFDPVTLQAGPPRLIDSRSNIRVPSGVSPDGSLIAYFSIGDRQEDLFVGPPRGSMRRVIDDAPRDRAPVFTPDGKSLVFYSNRSGTWQTWMVGLDGSGLRQLAKSPGGSVYALVSPRGDALIYTDDSARRVFRASLGSGETTAVADTTVNGNFLNPLSWSSDGARLAGLIASPSGRTVGVGIYDFATKTTTQVADDETYGVQWLTDNRRVVYFTNGGFELVVVDSSTKARTIVKVALPAPALGETFAISPDSRAIYYGAARAEADIWIIERK